ncbi:Addiction module toxin, Txe/YoeB [Lentisphaera araneosa HTCC2155]|uniref:Putative mRNA interferase YoeB n=1 Tax=Lentisphaera araneosa HTCC2155 TaxID=313628 RepID=A6DID0_9BACT|nr:Addiction module toxin, Txe/YoeB [Lentisphaera araneosa HTCC2155]
MEVKWTKKAIKDAQYLHSKDAESYRKLKELIAEIEKSPFTGIGKPEPLKDKLKGWWSRRINQKDRLVYRVSGKTPQVLEITSCRGHY